MDVVRTTTTTHGPATVARLLGVSLRSVERWVAANANEDRTRSHIIVGGAHVPAVRVGARWRIPAAALDDALRGEAVVA